MIDFIKKYWWAVVLFLITFPFLLNFAVILCIQSDLRVALELKDWMMFLGAYISSIASFGMMILTYAIIKQNDEIRRGTIVFRLIAEGKSYCIEYKNIGNSVACIKHLNFNDDFINKLDEVILLNGELTHKKIFERISNRQTYLNPQERKLIFLGECNQINCETELITTTIKISGTYETIGKSFEIKDEFCIDEFCFEYLAKKDTLEYINDINKTLEKINSAISKKCEQTPTEITSTDEFIKLFGPKTK